MDHHLVRRVYVDSTWVKSDDNVSHMSSEKNDVPQPGDLVRLNSGGPLMTFVRLQARPGAKPGEAEEAYCVWFSSDRMAQAGTFPLSGLTTSR